jgi:hypothetical protein
MKNKHWTGICSKPRGEADQRKPGKEPFWRKQEDAAKRGMWLRGWLGTVTWSWLHKCIMFLME